MTGHVKSFCKCLSLSDEKASDKERIKSKYHCVFLRKNLYRYFCTFLLGTEKRLLKTIVYWS